MGENQKGDLRISGSGSVGGGDYGGVHISGSGRVTGDLSCEQFSVSGSAHVAGSVRAENAGVSGSAHIDGGFTGGTLSVSGSSSVGGNIRVNRLRVSGSLHAQSGLQAETVSISGSLHLNGDCSAEEIRIDGGCTVGGVLNAGTVDFRLASSRSQAREIVGSRISVRRRSDLGGIFRALIGRPALLETELIEGDEVSLEYTKAAAVRGARVRIGPGCEIGTVEYRETFDRDDGSEVHDAKKI